MNNVNDLQDHEAETLVRKLKEIMHEANQSAEHGNSSGHKIYVLARDCMDMLVFDQVSRDMVRKLSQSDRPTVMGYTISDTVESYLRAGSLINAIKEFRNEHDVGLKEAKDVCERARIDLNIVPF